MGCAGNLMDCYRVGVPVNLGVLYIEECVPV